MDKLARALLDIGDKLFTERKSLLSYWQEVADNFYPERTDFIRQLWYGQELTAHLMESFPVLARRELGNAVSSMLRPRGKTWFSLSSGREEIDEIPAVKEWLEDAKGILYRAIYDREARFVRATKQCDHDYVTFGNGVLSVEEEPGKSHLLFRNWHLKDCAWSENACGEIDTMHRAMEMSARNLIARFPDTAHEAVREIVDREPDKKFKVRHVAIPQRQWIDMGGKRLGKGDDGWAHVYIDVDNQVVLKQHFRPEFGYVVPRWWLIAGFQYGFSLATTAALPDGRMAQQIARVIMENAEKAIDPPLVATMEAIKSDIDIFAGGVTWVDSEYDERKGDPLRPLAINGDVRLGMEYRQDVRNLLTQAFFLNKLMVPQTGDMTATEVQIRTEEFIRGALPVFEPIEVEYNSPLLSMVFEMLMRRNAFGKIDEIPEELHGRDISFTFDSPIQTAEKALKVAAFQQTAQMTGIAAQVSGDQGIGKTFDWRKALVDASDGAGASPDWQVDEDELEAQQAQQAQMGAIGNAAQLLSAGAGVAGQVADAKMKLDQAGMGL